MAKPKPPVLIPRSIKLENINYKMQDEDPDAVHHFIEINGVIPSFCRIQGPFLYKEIEELIEKSFDHVIKDWEYQDGQYRSAAYRVMYNNHQVIIKLKRSFTAEDTTFIIDSADAKITVGKNKSKYKDPKHGYLISTDVDLLYEISNKPVEFIAAAEKITLEYNIAHNKIHLICQDSDGMYTKEYPLVKDDKYDFDLDLHYGTGFNKFHETSIKRIDDNDKGIILFHGSPGTGKSFYIKRLIRDLMRRNKKILYLPNNMVDVLGTPTFNNFLLDWIDDNTMEGEKGGVLIIIEDAERVLLKRETNPYGADGVANILNSTDGILNDFLSIQVLATFNTEIENIDKAILRKKRAIAIREFKALTQEDSQKLIDHLQIKFTASEGMTLAEIYALKQDVEDQILMPTEPKQAQIGFKLK